MVASADPVKLRRRRRIVWHTILAFFFFHIVLTNFKSEVAASIAACLFLLAFLSLFYVLLLGYRIRRIESEQAKLIGSREDKWRNNNWITAVLAMVIIASLGILGNIAMSSQQLYKTRIQVTEAAGFGQHAADTVANYEREHQQYPKNLEQAGFAETLPVAVKKIGFDSQQGIVAVTMSKAPIDGKTLLLVPSKDANGKAMWKCMSQEVPEKYLPPGCRQNN